MGQQLLFWPRKPDLLFSNNYFRFDPTSTIVHIDNTVFVTLCQSTDCLIKTVRFSNSLWSMNIDSSSSSKVVANEFVEVFYDLSMHNIIIPILIRFKAASTSSNTSRMWRERIVITNICWNLSFLQCCKKFKSLSNCFVESFNSFFSDLASRADGLIPNIYERNYLINKQTIWWLHTTVSQSLSRIIILNTCPPFLSWGTGTHQAS